MRLFGLDIARTAKAAEKQYSMVSSRGGGGWWRVWEPWSGAWQHNVSIDRNLVLTYYAVYSCITLIASDIAKLRVKLVEQDGDGIWTETTNPAFSPVLRKPNRFQTRNQFWEYWFLSKLTTGNTYVLKERDDRNVVVRLYVLDPGRVRPMIADDGSVFYELWTDDLAPGLNRIGETVRVPAREIIHDRYNCIFHPLIGTSPIVAGGLAATQGMRMQTDSALFFQNRSMPGGLLIAPGAVSDQSAADLKTYFNNNFTGANAGKVAVLGDGLKYEQLAVSATDAQLIEQLKMTAEMVCSVYHVPPYKIGAGPMPTNNNVQTLNVEYYAQCLQALIEAAEESLDEGMGIGWSVGIGTEFDVDNLLRMDTLTQMDVLEKGVRAAVLAPNEGRRRFDLKPVKGGDTPYLQQQNFSLAALDKRDRDDPFSKPEPAPAAQPAVSQLPPPKGEKGDPGVPGRDGRDGKDGEKGMNGNSGKDGKDGAPGQDGFGFDDLSVEHDGGRQIVLRFARGETVKEFPLHLAVPIYRDVYRPEQTYQRGDMVTFGGSVWHCNAETEEKPGNGSVAWTLAVKEGRPGKAR